MGLFDGVSWSNPLGDAGSGLISALQNAPLIKKEGQIREGFDFNPFHGSANPSPILNNMFGQSVDLSPAPFLNPEATRQKAMDWSKNQGGTINDMFNKPGGFEVKDWNPFHGDIHKPANDTLGTTKIQTALEKGIGQGDWQGAADSWQNELGNTIPNATNLRKYSDTWGGGSAAETRHAADMATNKQAESDAASQAKAAADAKAEADRKATEAADKAAYGSFYGGGAQPTQFNKPLDMPAEPVYGAPKKGGFKAALTNYKLQG